MRQPKKKPRKLKLVKFRKIHIDRGEGVVDIWHYSHVGNGIVFVSPSLEKTVKYCTELFNVSWEWVERANWKEYWPEIRPSDVKNYIIKEFYGGFR